MLESLIPYVETVGDLKKFIKDIPDDYAVMIESDVEDPDMTITFDDEEMDLSYSMSMGYDPNRKIFFVLRNY